MSRLAPLHRTLHAATRPQVLMRGLKVALVVTPILTVLNHGGEILAGQMGPAFWLQVGATFLVPFTVSVISGGMAVSIAVAATERGTGRLPAAPNQ